MRLPRGAEGDDAEGHLRIVEGIPPCRDHLAEDLVVHRCSRRSAIGVVVALVENGAFDGQAGDRGDHAGIAVARPVLIHRRPGSQVVRLSPPLGDFPPLFLHVLDPVVEILDPVLEVLLGIEVSNFLVPLRQPCTNLWCIDLFQNRHRRPGLHRCSAPRGIDHPDGNLGGHMKTTGEDIPDGGKLAGDFRGADVPVSLAEMTTRPVAPFVQAGKAFLHLGSVLGGHRQNPYSRVPGRDDFQLSVLHVLKGFLHVALPTEDPDVSDQNVLEGQRLALPFYDKSLRFGICLHGGQTDLP